MPFIEILALDGCVTDKPAAAREMTRACDAFGMDAKIVTIFFIDTPASHFWHGAETAPHGGPNSVFVKVQALRRDPAKRRAAAEGLTRALCNTSPLAPADVAIYFLEREEDECAHGGKLTSDWAVRNP
jgi:phenylpyruvate tautomerase PptA (4-oxalocrotonate tautomerase family)